MVSESLLELGGVLKVWRWTCSSFPDSPGTFITPQFHYFWGPDLSLRGFSPRSGWLQPRGPHPKGPVREFHRSGLLAPIGINWPYGAPSCSLEVAELATCWVHRTWLRHIFDCRNSAAVGGMVQSIGLCHASAWCAPPTLTWGSMFLQCYPGFLMDANAPLSHWMVCRLNFLGVKGVKVYGCWNFLCCLALAVSRGMHGMVPSRAAQRAKVYSTFQHWGKHTRMKPTNNYIQLFGFESF